MRLCHILTWSLLVLAIPVTAQVQVRDAATQRNGGYAQTPPPTTGSTELSATMSSQIEALQQEVQTLRGVVEEQAYQLKRMQAEQKDRYLDIDRRLSVMLPAAPLANAKPVVPAKSAAPAAAPVEPVAKSTPAAVKGPADKKKAAADHSK